MPYGYEYLLEMMNRIPRKQYPDISGALTGIGNIVGQYGQNKLAEERMAKAYEAEQAKMAQERMHSQFIRAMQEKEFGLQQDKFGFQKGQAADELARARAQDAFRQRQAEADMFSKFGGNISDVAPGVSQEVYGQGFEHLKTGGGKFNPNWASMATNAKLSDRQARINAMKPPPDKFADAMQKEATKITDAIRKTDMMVSSPQTALKFIVNEEVYNSASPEMKAEYDKQAALMAQQAARRRPELLKQLSILKEQARAAGKNIWMGSYFDEDSQENDNPYGITIKRP